MLQVLRHRDLRLLLGAYAAAQAGNWLSSVTLAVYMLDLTGSAAWVAAAVVTELVPWVVLGPIGGVLADTFDRRRLLIAAALLQGIAMAGLAGSAALGLGPVAALAMAAIASAGLVVSNPNVFASIPELTDERELAAANALTTSIMSFSLVVGPAAGGVLLFLGSPAMAFGVNTLAYALAAVCLASIRSPMGPARAATRSGPREPAVADGRQGGIAALLTELAGGARALAASNATRSLVLTSSAVWFAAGIQGVLWALLADERLPGGADTVTLLYVGFGVGGLAGAVPAARLAARRDARLVLAGAAAVAGLSAVALGLMPSLLPALVVLAVQGAATGTCEILMMTLVQRQLGPDRLGRALGALDSTVSAAMVVGSLVAPGLVAAAGLEAGFVVTGLGFALAAATLVITRHAGRDVLVPEARVRALAAIPVFAPAPRFALEGLAAAAREEAVAVGTAVVRAGGEPDALYVILDGAFAVTAPDGAPLNTLGSGELFGEIGILKGIPRTATVTATTPATLLRIEAATFLALLRDGGVEGAALGRGVGVRLARSRQPGTRPPAMEPPAEPAMEPAPEPAAAAASDG